MISRALIAAAIFGAVGTAALDPVWDKRDVGAEAHILAARAPTLTHTSTSSYGPTMTLDVSTSVPSPTAPLNATLPPQAPLAPL